MDPSTKEIAEIKRSPCVPYPMLLVVNLGTTGHDITNLNNAFVIREISKKILHRFLLFDSTKMGPI